MVTTFSRRDYANAGRVKAAASASSRYPDDVPPAKHKQSKPGYGEGRHVKTDEGSLELRELLRQRVAPHDRGHATPAARNHPAVPWEVASGGR